MKNIIWLYKPYIKYGKILVILSIFFWLVLIPLNSILPIYFPQKIIDALESGKSFGEIIKITVFFQVFSVLYQCMKMFLICIIKIRQLKR